MAERFGIITRLVDDVPRPRIDAGPLTLTAEHYYELPPDQRNMIDAWLDSQVGEDWRELRIVSITIGEAEAFVERLRDPVDRIGEGELGVIVEYWGGSLDLPPFWPSR
jgi:hypothetical protein